MALIFGIGPGVLILAIVWFLTLLLVAAALSLRVQSAKKAAPGVVVVVVILTITLPLLPRESAQKTTESPTQEAEDALYVGRAVLLAFMGLSALGGLVALAALHFGVPVRASRIRSSPSHYWRVT